VVQSLLTSQTPASGNAANGNSISLGMYFTPAVDGVVTHLRQYFQTGTQPAGEAWKGALFRAADGVKIAGDVTYATPGTLGGWNQVALPVPVAVLAGVTYVVANRSPSLYVATTGGSSPWPVTNGDLSSGPPATAGRFEDNDGDGSVQFPTTLFNNGCYFADVVFEPGGAPETGTAAITLPALQSAVAGTVRATGTAAGSLPALAAAAAGTVRATGTAPVALPRLGAAATGTARATATSAVTLPALQAAAAGGISTSGTVAVTLPTLTAAVAGSTPGGVTFRPDAGTTVRPDAGVTFRP
jgi:hypothetical protein